jgi:hypothetical protein
MDGYNRWNIWIVVGRDRQHQQEIILAPKQFTLTQMQVQSQWTLHVQRELLLAKVYIVYYR